MEHTRFGEDWRRFSNSLRVSGGPCVVVPYKSSGVMVYRLSMAVASVRGRWGSRVCLRRRRFFSWTGAIEGAFFLAAGLSGGGEISKGSLDGAWLVLDSPCREMKKDDSVRPSPTHLYIRDL
ncbi:hypothetical protein F2Q69_00035000 [Brassica cretica]|uniref:Uncharacterized protein n=1 Tax=Brassica cretica TaxID=69181 RepID=A0A8S9SLT1_BRACR|nr:hypothetical protein F2Q69_00035000 [Brassica cretica]